MKRTCIKCGIEKNIEFFVKQSKRTDPYRHTCKECKNRKRRKGTISNTRFKKGIVPWSQLNKGNYSTIKKGIKISPEIVEKTAAKNRGKGKGRWTYNYHQWRNKVFARDDNKCQKCGSIKRLHCHHKIPWKENEKLRFDVDNGITYCQSCHAKTEGFQKGYIQSKEAREKMSLAKKGYVPWNKGLKNADSVN